MNPRLSGRTALALSASLVAVSLIAAACGGTSSADKTATARAAGGATTPAATSAATRAATSAATAAATKAATTPTAAATSAATPASGGASGAVNVGSTTLGEVLTDGAGMTLYTFDSDTTAGTSSCNGACAANWPPLTATSVPVVTGATGEFTLITRDDGTEQVAYNGDPLYRYAADTAPGDTKGDGVGGVWHAAKP